MTSEQKKEEIRELMTDEKGRLHPTINVLLDCLAEEQLDKVLKGLKQGHDQKACGCEYIGDGLWSCGYEEHCMESLCPK